ncbi:OLC1v1033519C1 [Oldenlandia corymbosa var. corymbosa]|uniref:OLC1v1033519C1 n=1 Tax=Oldenlandia corymbosa var. corymbosa TaxID=529605 RepID=A0AAV1CNC1_OLDCO|nr:OLC1v1033519C1 [Oldenlandia corymbosa var. corymbosa]
MSMARLHRPHPSSLHLCRSSLFITIFLLLFPSTTKTTGGVIMVTAAGDLNSDRQALLDFAATVPHPLPKKLNWNTNTSLCTTWAGVTCSSTNNATRVVALRLPAAGFYGSIPANTLGRLDALSSLSLRSNRLNGTLPPDILSLPSIRYLYFQNNNFSGDLPSNLSSQLNFLDLSFNSFTGNIPDTINNLTHLVGLNLQNNSFTGPVPDLLALSYLQQLNLSNNNLNGSIPHSLQHFPASSFQGNSLLCGRPLRQCPSPISPAPAPAPTPASALPFFKQSPPPSPATLQLPSPSPPTASFIHKGISKSKKLSTGSTAAIAAASCTMLFLLFLLCWMLCRTKKRGRDGKGKEFRSNGALKDENNDLVFLQADSTLQNCDLDYLLRASAQVLGKGTYGTTYKAILQDGTTLAVKRLKQVVAGKLVFEQHMENVGRVNHPNVVPLRAYHYSKDEKLLVYDYAPFGNLSTLLHGQPEFTPFVLVAGREFGRTLDWESRLKICLGAARGIAHIHLFAGGRLIHGNIKSSNILVNHNLIGCLSDFGITTLVGLYTMPSRRTGYQAPEVSELGKYTQKSDVYSFGIVLLEMLTGKPPIQYAEVLVVDLPRWVQSILREESTAAVFDSNLMKHPHHQNTEEEMEKMLHIALACVARLPETRPKMAQVLKMIQEMLQPDVIEN